MTAVVGQVADLAYRDASAVIDRRYRVSQFPTLGSVVFHVSRQPAWRDQEV